MKKLVYKIPNKTFGKINNVIKEVIFMGIYLVGTYEETKKNNFKTICAHTGKTIFVPLLKAATWWDGNIISPEAYDLALAAEAKPDPFADAERQTKIAWNMHLADPCGE